MPIIKEYKPIMDFTLLHFLLLFFGLIFIEVVKEYDWMQNI